VSSAPTGLAAPTRLGPGLVAATTLIARPGEPCVEAGPPGCDTLARIMVRPRLAPRITRKKRAPWELS
jgi:hypothetical protein